MKIEKASEVAEKIVKNNDPNDYVFYYNLASSIKEVEEDIVIIDELVDIALDSCFDPDSDNDLKVDIYTAIKIICFDLS